MGPSLDVNSKKSIGSLWCNTSTGSGGLSLKLSVPGTRRMRASSAVTAGSATRECLVHSALRVSATGFQSSLVISCLRIQYAWTPLPEFTSVGFGSFSSKQNSCRSSSASSREFCSALASPQSIGLSQNDFEVFSVVFTVRDDLSFSYLAHAK